MIIRKTLIIALAVINFLLAGIFSYILYIVTRYILIDHLTTLQILGQYLRTYFIQTMIFPFTLIPLSIINIYEGTTILRHKLNTRLLPAGAITIATILTYILATGYAYLYPPYMLDITGEQSFKTSAKIVNSELDNLPPISQWQSYRNEAFHIEIQYPSTNWSTAEHEDKYAYIKWNTNGWSQIMLYLFETTSQTPDEQVYELIDKAGWNHKDFQYTYVRNDFIQLTNLGRHNSGDPRYVLLQNNQAILLVFNNYAAETGNAHVPEYIKAIDRGLNMVANTIKTIE